MEIGLIESLSISVNLNKVVSNFARISKEITDAFASVNEVLQKYNEHIGELSFMSDQGWYIGLSALEQLNLPDFFQFHREKNFQKIKLYLIENFEDILPKVLIRAKTYLPERKEFIDELHKAFNSKMYFSAIHLSFSLIDGFSHVKWGTGFYDRKNGDRVLLKNTQSSSIKPFSNLLTQINDGNELDGSNKRNLFGVDALNRHNVMHGHSYLHGNMENAIRILLFMDFVFDLYEYQVLVKETPPNLY